MFANALIRDLGIPHIPFTASPHARWEVILTYRYGVAPDTAFAWAGQVMPPPRYDSTLRPLTSDLTRYMAPLRDALHHAEMDPLHQQVYCVACRRGVICTPAMYALWHITGQCPLCVQQRTQPHVW